MNRPTLRLRFRAMLGACLILLLGGCAGIGSRDAIDGLAAFEPLADNPQVRYAPGAERFARRVAAVLPAATAQIESLQYRPFRSAPVVYVCNDDACFNHFVAARYNFTAAVVYNNRLLLASRLFDREPQRLTPILLHELSHLHLGQRRGHYAAGIPVWFHEGLASLVAAGGGADLVTDEDAWTAVASDRYFRPDEQHLPWIRSTAERWNIPISVFYRQALLYLRDLRSRDQPGFRRLLESLQDGADFDSAFAQAFQTNAAHSALAFFRHLCDSVDDSRPGGRCRHAPQPSMTLTHGGPAK